MAQLLLAGNGEIKAFDSLLAGEGIVHVKVDAETLRATWRELVGMKPLRKLDVPARSDLDSAVTAFKEERSKSGLSDINVSVVEVRDFFTW